MMTGLRPPLEVPFERLFLDPNNPRLGSSARSLYRRPESLVEPAEQDRLEAEMARVHPDLEELEAAILGMGWLPVDPILVWELPTGAGYVVVEGNSRLTALRRLHRKLRESRARIERQRDRAPLPGRRESRLAPLERVAEATARLGVIPIQAATAKELEEVLPRWLGVRHITHARQWRPAALHLYIHSVYSAELEKKRKGEPLRLDDELLKRVGGRVCLSSWKVRRAVQAVSFLAAFRKRFEARLPPGERFEEADQALFLQLLEPGHARQEFAIQDADLELSPAREEALFQLTFVRPRSASHENVWRGPGDVKLWNRMARFDEKHGTRLAAQIDVRDPARARPMASLELDYLALKSQKSPVDAVRSLIQALRRVEVGTLQEEKDELRRLVTEMMKLGSDYQRLLEAVK